jgi:N-acetylglucosamine-6-phosphate deacetylase
VLTPGFVDLHVHGGGGGDASEGAAGLARMLGAHRAHGTTRTALSLVSAPVDRLATLLRELAPVVRADPLLLGIHLEGPFLSPDNKGAHDPAVLTVPTPEAVQALLDAADGTLLQITIAPELPGAQEATRAFTAAGVRVAVGHTVADLDVAGAGFDAGATQLTHAFNAMPGLAHRAPGPIGAAVERPEVVLELVADGLHVHPILVAGLFRLAPGRVALITDAMAAAGYGDGSYRLGTLDVEVRDGAARLPDGKLAGSTLTLDAAIRTAVGAGVPLEEAVLAATATPARAAGRPELGVLEPGSPADAVLLTDALEVEAVWADGARLR